MTPIVYVAGDGGPRQTLAGLARSLPGLTIAHQDLNQDEPLNVFRANGTKLLIIGTSESPTGRALETRWQLAATRESIPIIQIEDYPGNFRPGTNRRCDLLIADGDDSLEIAKLRWGNLVPPSLAVNTPRYDPLREQSVSRSCRSGDGGVLWVGQPETVDCIQTLERVLPLMKSMGRELLFRAHPGDEGYGANAYARILDRHHQKIRDVTQWPWPDCIHLNPALLLTQYSSLAVEAGFHGIPSVHLLYADTGGQRLLEKKGYPIPPMCLHGAAFAITKQGSEFEVLHVALHDDLARHAVREAFHRIYKHPVSSASVIARHLYNLGLIDWAADY